MSAVPESDVEPAAPSWLAGTGWHMAAKCFNWPAHNLSISRCQSHIFTLDTLSADWRKHWKTCPSL